MQKSSCLDFHIRVKVILLRYFCSSGSSLPWDRLNRTASKAMPHPRHHHIPDPELHPTLLETAVAAAMDMSHLPR